MDTEAYLARCLVYIDLNIVRAGVVSHPRQWPTCGYHEIQHPSKRYRIVDVAMLRGLLGLGLGTPLQRAHTQWEEEALHVGHRTREGIWSESLAVGSKPFVESVKAQLDIGARYRQVQDKGMAYSLEETSAAYSAYSGTQTGLLSIPDASSGD